jgi:glyoxylase-like metal-dependent hydrolase (beta-lactamase superfamily II)
LIADPAPLPVANGWYAKCRVHCETRIFEPHVAPLLRGNIWHVRARDADLVIDGGLGLVPLRPMLDEEPGRTTLFIATHGHRDHVGSAHEFEQVMAHTLEVSQIETAADDLPLDVRRWSEDMHESFESQGYTCRCGLMTALPVAGFDLNAAHATPATVTRPLAEGDVIDLGDRAFEVLHLPGHSPGSIGLYDRRAHALFSGDAIYNGPLLSMIEGCDLAAYCATLERLLRLDVEIVHGGHDDSFGRERLAMIARHYLSKWEKLL